MKQKYKRFIERRLEKKQLIEIKRKKTDVRNKNDINIDAIVVKTKQNKNDHSKVIGKSYIVICYIS